MPAERLPGEDWFAYHERVGTQNEGAARAAAPPAAAPQAAPGRQPGEDWFAYHERVGTTQEQGDAARAAARAAAAAAPRLPNDTEYTGSPVMTTSPGLKANPNYNQFQDWLSKYAPAGGGGMSPGQDNYNTMMPTQYNNWGQGQGGGGGGYNSGILPGEMNPYGGGMSPGYRNPYAPSPFYQQRFDRYAPMMPQGGGGGGGRYGNQNMGPILGGGMGQVIPTNIPFRDQGYGAPMMSQNLIQSLSGPNNLMNPYRRDTTLDMLDRFRGGGGGWGGMPNDPYYGRWGGGGGGGGGYPPPYGGGGGYPPGGGGGGGGGKGGRGGPTDQGPLYGTPPPETGNGAPPASGGFDSPNTWGDQASNNSYTEDIWSANGTWLVKDAQGQQFRVGSEAEAIAATGGNIGFANGGHVGAAQPIRRNPLPPPVGAGIMPAHLGRRPPPNLKRLLDQLDSRRA